MARGVRLELQQQASHPSTMSLHAGIFTWRGGVDSDKGNTARRLSRIVRQQSVILSLQGQLKHASIVTTQVIDDKTDVP